MIDNEIKNSLYERLKIYLSNDSKKYDVSQVIETIVFLLENYFDFDYKKFIDALDVFSVNKQSKQYVKYAEPFNRVDISKTNSISVKGFLSKNSPMLFFYMGDDDNPCVKVKTNFDSKQDVYSIELSNSSKVLCQYKKGGADFSNAYVIDYEYNYSGKTVERVKNVFAETKAQEDTKFLNVIDFEGVSEEYKNFLILLNNAVSFQGFNPSYISGFGLDILLHSFYDEIKNLCLDEFNFSLENIVYLINSTLYKDKNSLVKPESIFLDFIQDVSYETDFMGSNKKMKLKIPVSDRVVEYNVVKSEKYLCVDAIERGKTKCGIMIVSTADGFSLCVTNKTSEKINRPSFVMNFSENQVRVMTIDSGLNKEGQALLVILTFDDGKINLNYSNSEIQKIKNYKELNIASYGQLI